MADSNRVSVHTRSVDNGHSKLSQATMVNRTFERASRPEHQRPLSHGTGADMMQCSSMLDVVRLNWRQEKAGERQLEQRVSTSCSRLRAARS
jgi:hypothetical protein